MLPCWLPVAFTAVCKGARAEVWFVRFSCMVSCRCPTQVARSKRLSAAPFHFRFHFTPQAGLINDLSIVVFSLQLSWIYPAIGFSISIGLAVVSSLDEWVRNMTGANDFTTSLLLKFLLQLTD